MLNGVIEGGHSNTTCAPFSYASDRLLVSRDRDSRPPLGVNRKSMVCGVIDNDEKKNLFVSKT